MRNYLKIGILLFGIVFVLVNCRIDDFVNNNTSFERKEKIITKNISSNEIPAVMNFITNITSKDLTINIDDVRNGINYTKSIQDDIILTNIETENIIQTINDSNKSNYSFKLTKENHEEEDKSILNFIVKETDYDYDSYIIKYEPNELWLQNNDFNFETFQGKVVIYNNQGKYIVHYDIDSGELVNKSGVVNPCDPDLGDGNPSPSGTDPGDTGPGGDGAPPTGPSNPSDGNPSPGGGSDDDDEEEPDGPGPGGECCFYYDGEGDMIWFHDHSKISFRPETLEIIFNPDVDRFLKNGFIDSNGDCIPDSDDDGYEDPTNDDENDVIGINPPIRTPCEQMYDLANDVDFKVNLSVLKQIAQNTTDPNANREVAYTRDENGNFSTPILGPIGEGTVEVNVTVRLSMHMHSHPIQFENNLSIFSAADLYSIYKLFTENKTTYGHSFTLVLVTATTTYALKIDSSLLFMQAFQNSFGSLGEDGVFLVEEYMNNNNIKYENTIAENEQGFLKMLYNQNSQNGGSGLEMFKANADYSTWTKLEYNNRNHQITQQPCN